MGTFLATSLFAVPLFAGLSWELVPDALRPRMALLPSAPRGIFARSWNPFFDRYAVHDMAPAWPGWMR
jgi:hypothetical protein